MSIAAVVPVKGLGDAKSRLASVLTSQERRTLATLCLDDTVSALAHCESVDRVFVVTAHAQAAAKAEAANATVVSEPGECAITSSGDPHVPLNRALEAGRLAAVAAGAEALLTLPIDLVLLPGFDLASCLGGLAPEEPPFIAIATDHQSDGTNFLLQSPADAIPFRYGRNSAARHRSIASDAHLQTARVDEPALLWDLDSPDDPTRLATALTLSRSQQGRLWKTYERAKEVGTALPFLLSTDWARPLRSLA